MRVFTRFHAGGSAGGLAVNKGKCFQGFHSIIVIKNSEPLVVGWYPLKVEQDISG